jgi:hypothetical protein
MADNDLNEMIFDPATAGPALHPRWRRPLQPCEQIHRQLAKLVDVGLQARNGVRLGRLYPGAERRSQGSVTVKFADDRAEYVIEAEMGDQAKYCLFEADNERKPPPGSRQRIPEHRRAGHIRPASR